MAPQRVRDSLRRLSSGGRTNTGENGVAEEARELYNRGVRLAESGDSAGASTVFTSALVTAGCDKALRGSAHAWLGILALEENDTQRAITCFRAGVTAGSMLARTNLGVLCARAGRHEDAYVHFAAAAEKGYAEAILNVGKAMLLGEGVKKDAMTAAKKFQLAADAGEPFGWYNLALLYEAGLGVERNEANAINLYEKALQLGVQDAEYELMRIRMEQDNGKNVHEDTCVTNK